MPDFRDFQGRGIDYLAHSAKGTTWNNHKYIKKIWMGTRWYYIYPSMTKAFKEIGDQMTGFNEQRKQRKADLMNAFGDIAKKVANDKAAARKRFFGDVANQANKMVEAGKGRSIYKKSSGVQDVDRVSFTNKKSPIPQEPTATRNQTSKAVKQTITNKLVDVNEQVVLREAKPTNEMVFKGLPTTRKIYKKGRR